MIVQQNLAVDYGLVMMRRPAMTGAAPALDITEL
jgi:hypothetical protein